MKSFLNNHNVVRCEKSTWNLHRMPENLLWLNFHYLSVSKFLLPLLCSRCIRIRWHGACLILLQHFRLACCSRQASSITYYLYSFEGGKSTHKLLFGSCCNSNLYMYDMSTRQREHVQRSLQFPLLTCHAVLHFVTHNLFINYNNNITINTDSIIRNNGACATAAIVASALPFARSSNIHKSKETL